MDPETVVPYASRERDGIGQIAPAREDFEHASTEALGQCELVVEIDRAVAISDHGAKQSLCHGRPFDEPQ